MTITQMQRRLVRAVRDLDAVSDELTDRCLEAEDVRIVKALTLVGQVCIVFLDQEQLKPLRTISDVRRRMPYSTTDENYISVEDRADIDGTAAERLCERIFSTKKPRKRTKVVPIAPKKKQGSAA